MELKPGLEVKHWWHALTLFGAAASLAIIAAPIDKLLKGPALLAALGLFFLGIGEWINHPVQTAVIPPNATLQGGGIVTGYPRRSSAVGVLFTVAGLLLLLVGLGKLAWRA